MFGGNSAGQAAVHLAKFASRVTILVRSDTLAQSMSDYLVTEIERTDNIDVKYRVEVVGGSGDGGGALFDQPRHAWNPNEAPVDDAADLDRMLADLRAGGCLSESN
jgi:cation diffusion facilitator CzcD-associated flavoprotein CzcO